MSVITAAASVISAGFMRIRSYGNICSAVAAAAAALDLSVAADAAVRCFPRVVFWLAIAGIIPVISEFIESVTPVSRIF